MNNTTREQKNWKLNPNLIILPDTEIKRYMVWGCFKVFWGMQSQTVVFIWADKLSDQLHCYCWIQTVADAGRIFSVQQWNGMLC